MRFKPERRRHGFIIVVHIAAEIGRIVGIDAGLQAKVEHFLQWVVAHILNHTELQVAQRADG